MRKAKTVSLIIDREFAAELEKLELPDPPDADSAASLECLDTLEDGPDSDHRSDVDSEARTPRRATFEDEDWAEDQGHAARPPQTGLRRAVLQAGGFLLMMGVGAGAAAVVFHDRLAQLLR